MQLVLIFVRELLRLAAEVLDQFADEGAGAGRGVEDLDVLVDQVLAEVLLAQPVGALDHEADDLVRRVDDAEPVGGLRVIDLVEVLVDDLEEGLLLVMARDLRCGRADRGVVGLERLQRVPLHRAGEEFALQRIEFLRDVVLAVEIALVENVGEDLLGQDVLDQHLAHVGLAERGLIVSLACFRNLSRPLKGSIGHRRSSILSRRALRTEGRSVLNWSTAFRNSRFPRVHTQRKGEAIRSGCPSSRTA